MGLSTKSQSSQAEELGLNFDSLIPELVCSSYMVSTENEVQKKEGTGQLNFDVVSWGRCPTDEGVCVKGRLSREKVACS